jgi:hypothetical protein
MNTDKLIHLLAQDAPSKPLNLNRTLAGALVLAAGLSGAIFIALLGIRPDVWLAGFAPTLGKLLLGIVIAFAAYKGALQLARPETTAVDGAKWLSAVIVLLAAFVALEFYMKGAQGWSTRMLGKSIYPCLLAIPAIAIAPLVASIFALRSGATTNPTATGSIAGLASGGLAIISYGFFCTEDSFLFFSAWYSFAALIVASIGAGLGRKFLSW